MSSPRKRDNTTPSCAVCQRRKVKCNRVFPCAACTKSGLECSFSDLSRKRKRTSVDAHAALARDGAGLSRVDPLQSVERIESGQSALMIGGENAIPNGNYTSGAFGTALPHLSSANASLMNGNPSERHERSFVFGSAVGSVVDVQNLSRHAPAIWWTYRTNIDPLIKVFHTQDVQKLVFVQDDISKLTAQAQCLFYAICFISVVSMTEDQCCDTLQFARTDLTKQLRHATETALSNADFMRSANITLLQAFVLYLYTLRSLGETHNAWTMTGIATHMAITLELNQDGLYYELPPLECETRRRLWWTVCFLTVSTAQALGQSCTAIIQISDVRQPSNVSEHTLDQSKSRTPAARAEPTGASFTILTAALLRDAHFSITHRSSVDVVDDILQDYDPGVPLQLFALNYSKLFPTRTEFTCLVKASRSFDKLTPPIFDLALAILEIQLELWSVPDLQLWHWYLKGDFHWPSLACILRRFRFVYRIREMERAWVAVRNVFDYILPALEIGPEIRASVDAIGSMLSIVNLSQGRLPANVSDTYTEGDQPSSSHQTAKPLRPYLFGSRPHDACLPGMDSTKSSYTIIKPTNAATEPPPNLDFERVDWNEFDRRTSELVCHLQLSSCAMFAGHVPRST